MVSGEDNEEEEEEEEVPVCVEPLAPAHLTQAPPHLIHPLPPSPPRHTSPQVLYSVQCTIGWSDFVLFGFSKTYTFLSIGYIFRSVLFITGTLSEIYFANSQIPFFYINEHWQNRKLKIKIFLTFYFRPPKWAKWCLTWTKEKSKHFERFSFFAFKQTKERILLQCNH